MSKMSKRRLRRPELPPGARLDFFLGMQQLVVDAGDPSVDNIGKRIDRSGQTVHKALTGPKLPSTATLHKIIAELAESETERRRHEEAYKKALTEERAQAEASEQAPTPHIHLDLSDESPEGSGLRVVEILRNLEAVPEEEIYTALDTARKREGASIRKMSDDTGIPKSTLSRFFLRAKDDAKPSRRTTARVLAKLITDPVYLEVLTRLLMK